MVMSHQRRQRLKPLLDKVPPGFLVDTRYLRAQCINAKSIHNYVEHGWLERVVRGVYRRPLAVNAETEPVVSWHYVLLSLQHVMGVRCPSWWHECAQCGGLWALSPFRQNAARSFLWQSADMVKATPERRKDSCA